MRIYDSIGHGYKKLRREDPRIAARILDALGDSSSVLNVGAGAGSYEPRDRGVVAVEPSETMIQQRPKGAAPVVRASAGSLPFHDDSFDSSLAILTIHHWGKMAASLSELRRVARRRVVILTWDPASSGFWLKNYFPEILEIDKRIFPPMEMISKVLGPLSVTEMRIPSDCTDGFLGAYWRRPDAYLIPAVRKAISTFSKIDDLVPGLARLQKDLETKEWLRQYGEVRKRSSLDLGYRLVVANLQDGD